MNVLLINSILFSLILAASLSVSSQNQQSLPQVENPRIIIKKEQRELQLFEGSKLIKTYKIALGVAPKGDKRVEGDGRTPEGKFYVFTKNPESRFHLSLGLSYPNIEAAKRGLQDEIITPAEHDEILEAIKNKKMPPQKTALGGEIYIHGGGNSKDWTEGCIALENEEIAELFAAIPVGTEVEILP